MSRRMKTKPQIETERTRMQNMLDGRYAQHWEGDGHLALHAAIEALEWVLKPWPGKRRMKTRARIEEMTASLRKTPETEKDDAGRRRRCFSVQALGWILEPDNLPVTVCFTWTTGAVEDGPRKFVPVRRSR